VQLASIADDVFKVSFTEAELVLLERNFQAIKKEARGPIHPKLAKDLRWVEKYILKGEQEGIEPLGVIAHAPLCTYRSTRTY
jgi:hypothetical protein